MAKSAPTFPYQFKQIEFGRLFNPVILLPVKVASGWQNLWFLVDSGADTVMLPVGLGRALGLKFDPSVKTSLWGIGKQAVKASPGEVTLKINSRELTARSYFVHSTDSALLLGRLDVFEQFSITFNRKRQAVVFG